MMEDQPFTTPESRAALDRVRAFVLEHQPAGFLDSHALELAFKPAEAINAEIAARCDEFLEGFRQTGASRAFSHAVAFSLATLLRERISEIEAMQKGSA